MAKEKKGRRWDGKSRVSTELYRRRFNEIFKKEKTTSKTLISPAIHLRNLVSALIFNLVNNRKKK